MTTSSPAPLYCIKTPNGDFICEVVSGPVYDYRSIFRLYEVRAVKGRLNPINRMIVPEWKLSNKVAPINKQADHGYADQELELSEAL